MSRAKIEFIVCAALLTLIFALSLSLRIILPWDHVFSGQWIKFTDNDAYYYVRLLDNLSRHFPLLGTFDPYQLFPGGRDLSGQPLFFVYFMGFFTWLFGGSTPTQHMVDMVGVILPPVMGALLVFPAFLIGRAVFNKWAGLIAALFITLLPGEFLVRTLLGNPDSHIMEIFFSTLFILFVLLAARRGSSLPEYPFTAASIRKQTSTLVYSLLAGICLGIYLLSWMGALFFVLISFVWLVIQVIFNHNRNVSSGSLGLSAVTFYTVALLMSLAQPGNLMVLLSLAAGIAASAVLPVISSFMMRRKMKTANYVVAVAALAIIGLSAIYIVSPAMIRSMFNAVAGFFTWNPGLTIAESQPLLINQGSFSLALLWGNYTAASVMALIALVIVIYTAIRKGNSSFTLLAVWSILTLLAALALRRFAYYFAVPASILSGYSGWLILKAAGFGKSAGKTSEQTAKEIKKKSTKARRTRNEPANKAANPVLMTLAVAAVAFLAVYPNTGPLPGGDKPFYDVATKALYTPSNAWCETLDWMRINTPEPLGDAQYYYKYYQKGASSSSLSDSPAAYSVLCWWDYGYWISRIAHRVPFSNPGTAQLGEHFYFMAQDNQEATKLSSNWGVKYVIVNNYLVDWNSGFKVVAGDASQPSSKYFEVYYRSQGGKLAPTLLYYPEYYKTMAVRLYCFDGNEYTPQESAVIAWEQRTGADGKPYKEITGLQTFRSYDDAVSYIDSQKGKNLRIVGKDPNVSPVPLEAISGYKLAYGSSQAVKMGTINMPEVKVFENTGGH